MNVFPVEKCAMKRTSGNLTVLNVERKKMKIKRKEFNTEDEMNKFLAERDYTDIIYIQGLEDGTFEVGVKDE